MEIKKTVEDDILGFPLEEGTERKERSPFYILRGGILKKRKKIPTVTGYDPYRLVDPAKFEDLNTWLSSSPERCYPFSYSIACYRVPSLNNDHWLALEIDLSGRSIYAYDIQQVLCGSHNLIRNWSPFEFV
ncbi:protein-export protein SecB, partial [Striga asiatica]